MPDAYSEPVPANTVDKSPDADKPAKKSGGALRIILIVIMLVMFGLLGYDRYARAVSNQKYEEIKTWVEQSKSATPEEVQKMMGRAPDNGLEVQEHYWQETYSWRAGSLFKSYFITVFYESKDDKPVLYEFVFNQEPETNDIPNPPPPELTEEQLADGAPIEGSGEESTVDGPKTDGEATDGEEESAP